MEYLFLIKARSPELKTYVTDSSPMYERLGCGEYKVLDYYKLHEAGQNSLTKYLIISLGEYISYQWHNHRIDIWTFTEGIEKFILNDVVKEVHRGDVAVITPDEACNKRITELHIIEVQIGDELYRRRY